MSSIEFTKESVVGWLVSWMVGWLVVGWLVGWYFRVSDKYVSPPG